LSVANKEKMEVCLKMIYNLHLDLLWDITGTLFQNGGSTRSTDRPT
jgi:hypothetical protein